MGFSLVFDETTIPVLQQMSEGIPGGFFIYHADGDEALIYHNSPLLRMFGCDTEEEFRKLTGYTFRGMVHPEDIEAVENSIRMQIANSVYDLDFVEYRIVQKNGDIRWIEDYGHFIHTEHYGDIFCVFIDDATERLKKHMVELKNMNTQLRNAYLKESQYKKAILHDASFFFEINLSRDEIITREGQLGDAVKYGLPETTDIHTPVKYSGYIAMRANDVDRSSMAEYMLFFDPERLIGCYRRGELEQTFHAWVKDSRGRKRLRHYVMLLGENEGSQDVVALFIAKDRTEQAEKENLLESALRRAESAKVARNAFLANMSHDIRTPLNAIIGYTDLIRNHLSDSGKVEEYAKKIRMSGEQLLSIVNESLEVTRMESGRVSLAEESCNLEKMLTEVARMMESAMKSKAITFEMDYSGVRHFAVIVDYVRLEEILCQLLDNALKYTYPNGWIRLMVKEEEADFLGHGRYQFIVEDNGIGISREFMDVLFEPFKRENNTTQSRVAGTGLGLTLVKGLVDMMDGEIDVQSQPGSGSCFTVKLLLKRQEEQVEDSMGACGMTGESQQEISLSGKRILLVEDNEINREIAEELLISEGYLVESAENGSVALNMVQNAVPGYYFLILMDIQMPVMDGYEATREIRKLENAELARIPIITLSANAFAEDYRNSLEAGVDAHFPKPLDIDNLQRLIRNVMRERMAAAWPRTMHLL